MLNIKISNDKICIRSFLSADISSILELYDSAGGSRYATGLEHPVTICEIEKNFNQYLQCVDEFFVGIFDVSGNIGLVGLIRGIMKQSNENIVWIKILMIAPKYQNRGFGKLSIQKISDYFKETYKTKYILISVAEKNRIGYDFWRKIGFEDHEILNDKEIFQGDKQKVYILKKCLFNESILI